MTKPTTVLHPRDPRHGQYAGYQAGCRLACCWTARRRYDRARAYDVNAGRARVVDATAAREHIARCVRWGVRFTAFGATSTNAPRILRGDITQIHTGTERQILEVQPRPGVNCFAAFAATRRLRALVALGHAQSDIARAEAFLSGHVCPVPVAPAVDLTSRSQCESCTGWFVLLVDGALCISCDSLLFPALHLAAIA